MNQKPSSFLYALFAALIVSNIDTCVCVQRKYEADRVLKLCPFVTMAQEHVGIGKPLQTPQGELHISSARTIFHFV